MHKHLTIFIFSLLIAPGIIAQEKENRFASPLAIPLYLSANFAELRSDHFHSGIDIKTEGVTGKEVYSAADGYVYLVLVSHTGFGKALYIRHSFGLSTVYAHLDRFSPEIEKYAKEVQYSNKSYSITAYPPENRFGIRKGQLIGYSGNTGSSFGPHLHFEVRKSDGEKPVNPLDYGFGITDNLKPVIEKLAIYPLSTGSVVEKSNSRKLNKISGSDGAYRLTGGNTLTVKGRFGFAIQARDLVNFTNNKFGITELELFLDSVSRFRYRNNEFYFHESRYINAFIDYEALVNEKIELQRLFILPGNKIGTYPSSIENGIIELKDTLLHKVTIVVTDGKGNKSELSFRIKQDQNIFPEYKPTVQDYSAIMSYTTRNRFSADGFSIEIPEGALYDTLFFNYSSSEGIPGTYSRVHAIHNKSVPLHKSASITMVCDTVIPGKEDKMVAVRLSEDGKFSYAGGAYADGKLKTEIMAFGNYSVGIDTIPPEITALSFGKGTDMTGRDDIRFRIKDNLSGIRSYSGTIDGSWVLIEYDAKNNLLIYKFDSERLKRGITHSLKLTVTDNRANSTTLTRDIKW